MCILRWLFKVLAPFPLKLPPKHSKSKQPRVLSGVSAVRIESSAMHRRRNRVFLTASTCGQHEVHTKTQLGVFAIALGLGVVPKCVTQNTEQTDV